MNNRTKRLAGLGALNLGLLLGIPASSHLVPARPSASTAKSIEANLAQAMAAVQQAGGTKSELQAEIVPAATFAVGTSLGGGPDGKSYGVGLTANDISNSWTTCSTTCTLDFVFFVFSAKAEAAKVQFKMVSPRNTTIYSYTWSSKLTNTNWYAAYAKGTYGSAGTYFAEVYVAGALEGWAPVVFNKAA